MKQYGTEPIKPSEITPEDKYINRRQFMKATGIMTAAAFLASCAPKTPAAVGEAGATSIATAASDVLTSPEGEALTSFENIAGFNNYYEFSLSKDKPAELAKDFPTRPWTVEVGGLVNNPMTLDIDDLISRYEQEERVYRLRCVEAWSMVIPWTGFPLHKLLKDVEPMASAKYVRFESVFDPDNMRGQQTPLYPWPYTEGLRVDEAMNDLTLLATGLYGKPLPNQNGAPIRLAVPWKYGFKSIKAIMRIDLVEEQPDTLWNTIAPNEYGFYSNVNPEKDHPRWSQSTERRIGESGRQETLKFNGYADQVADLYKDMDLDVYF
ncbi:MAG: protein-methionine-sulfoxide reductase catalytic subunit MsrP [Anaerolineaceae bacterium]|nr:protein-methionine-sulfoxide reductase catalytic subunit MsrP [Anaerolineaceae bacterium]